VALDRSADDVRPYLEAAAPTHPSLIDTAHVVADRYAMINVPTVVWIDEAGTIVRPNDVAFGTDTFKDLISIDSDAHHAALRAWVREGVRPVPSEQVGSWVNPPNASEQQARAEFALAWHLHQAGDPDAAERHFARADALAPHDFTIRRGSMPIRGKDPMGADFADMFTEWMAAGQPYYPRLLAKRGN
jgi:hypothetical protein